MFVLLKKKKKAAAQCLFSIVRKKLNYFSFVFFDFWKQMNKTQVFENSVFFSQWNSLQQNKGYLPVVTAGKHRETFILAAYEPLQNEIETSELYMSYLVAFSQHS